MADKPKIPRYPIEGVEVWENQKNKFVVFQLHYSANPDKKDPAYRESVKSAMPVRQYLQEYELIWESYAGFPVYPDWDLNFHGCKEDISPIPGLPLLRGWDFGLSPACLVGQLVEDELRILREFTETNMGADRFSDKVLRACSQIYPNWWSQKEHWMDYIDASGEFRTDTDEGTCAQILQDKGLRCIPGEITWEKRRSSVEDYLIKKNKNGALFRVSIPNCPTLVRGFKGGYRYPEKAIDRALSQIRPLKDEHSHIHDALQMITSRIITMKRRFGSSVRVVPRPSYAWENR